MTNIKHYLPLRGLSDGKILIKLPEKGITKPIFSMGLNLTKYDLHQVIQSQERVKVLLSMVESYGITFMTISDNKVSYDEAAQLALMVIKETDSATRSDHRPVYIKILIPDNIYHKVLDFYPSTTKVLDPGYRFHERKVEVNTYFGLWESLNRRELPTILLVYPRLYSRESYKLFGVEVAPKKGLVNLKSIAPKATTECLWFNKHNIQGLLNLKPQYLTLSDRIIDGSNDIHKVLLKKLGIKELKGKIAITTGVIGDYEVVNMIVLDSKVTITLYPKYHYFLDFYSNKGKVMDIHRDLHTISKFFRGIVLNLLPESSATYILRKHDKEK